MKTAQGASKKRKLFGRKSQFIAFFTTQRLQRNRGFCAFFRICSFIVKKHGISFRSAARIFFDYDRIEFFDDNHSGCEVRYDTIGDTSAGRITQVGEISIGNVNQFSDGKNEILFVVYTERVRVEENGKETDVTRLISARLATEFERGLYYGKS